MSAPTDATVTEPSGKHLPTSAGLPPARRQPGVGFLLSSPAHLIALGAGSGLAPFAAGTWGTLLALVTFKLLDPWLSDSAWAALLAAAIPLGAWAAHRTGARLGEPDSRHIVIDEIVAFWLVLWLLPAGAGAGWQAAAFVLFRALDIAKPPPIARLDARLKHGVGVMLDDLIAAFYTLLLLAIVWRLTGG